MSGVFLTLMKYTLHRTNVAWTYLKHVPVVPGTIVHASGLSGTCTYGLFHCSNFHLVAGLDPYLYILVRDSLATMKTHRWQSATICSLVQCCLWHISHFPSQFYCLYYFWIHMVLWIDRQMLLCKCQSKFSWMWEYIFFIRSGCV